MNRGSFISYKLLTVFLLCCAVRGQSRQRFAYVNMAYILEQMPIYKNAQRKIDEKIKLWQEELSEKNQEVERLKKMLSYHTNEKVIAQRRKMIAEKEKLVKEKRVLYFGEEGLLFKIRKELIKPIQDQIFRAVQRIAKQKKYDFVFDTAGNFSVLYANPVHDISDLVMRQVQRNLKKLEK